MTDLRQLLGTNIRIYRKSCSLSQSKLAERVDTTTNYISAIEAGRRFPSLDILERIANALDIDTPELFSMKPIELDTAKKELENKIWQEIGQNLTSYITNRQKGLNSV
jgi:transcriptional regulator with XRE-family HTH domain